MTDEHLTRVGFMSPRDVNAFVSSLGDLFGFALVGPEDEFLDIAIVDQHTGPTRACSWLEFGRSTDGTPCCWLFGTHVGEFGVPADWSRADLESLSFVSNEEMPGILIEKAGSFDLSLDPDSGKTKYVGRPFADLHEAEDLYRRAKQLEETGELVEASHLYERALQVRPGNANLWYAAGVLRAKVDSSAAAIPYFEKAIELSPDFQHAACNLGAALSSVDRTDEALRWLHRAVELVPADPLAWWGLATTLEKVDAPKARVAFREFIRVANAAHDQTQEWGPMLEYARPRALS